MFGTLADFDELFAALHDRGIKLVMDLVVNHTSDEHPWFIESASVDGQSQAGLVLVAAGPRGMRAGDPGAEPTNWRSFFSGSAWEFDEATGEYYLHISRAGSQTSTGRIRGAAGDLRDDALVARPRGRRIPHGRHQHDLQGPDAARRASSDTVAVGRRARRTSSCGPRLHEYLQEMHREVFADRDGHCLTVGEMPGVTVEQARLFTDPARGELDMVFQFEHVCLDQGRVQMGPATAAAARL